MTPLDTSTINVRAEELLAEDDGMLIEMAIAIAGGSHSVVMAVQYGGKFEPSTLQLAYEGSIPEAPEKQTALYTSLVYNAEPNTKVQWIAVNPDHIRYIRVAFVSEAE